MINFKTISQFHSFVNLPAPLHPLISVIDVETVPQPDHEEPATLVLDFYSIAVKRMSNVRVRYGQQPFEFNEGIMSFMAPGQVFSTAIVHKDKEVKRTGWVIYIHPDFLWNSSLAKIIKNYDFWDYSLNEALFVSGKEEMIISNIIQNIFIEYQSNIDKFSKQIIISQIEGLLSYADRFYHRQFIIREKSGHQVLEKLEILLNDYFNSNELTAKGLPTVQFIAGELHISPKYLSSMLKALTGLNTQQHIHEKLIAKAKEQISGTTLSISEIAYSLGFEHLQSFSKLFKSKTRLSPLEFRASFS